MRPCYQESLLPGVSLLSRETSKTECAVYSVLKTLARLLLKLGHTRLCGACCVLRVA